MQPQRTDVRQFVRHEVARTTQAIVATYGLAALEMPKRAAAVHEAGHAVIYTVEGMTVRLARLKRHRLHGKTAWGGRTDTTAEDWVVDPTTDPTADLRQARFVLAGVCAEALLAPDHYRPGSSLDELAIAGKLCAYAGSKLNRAGEDLIAEQHSAVHAMLLANAEATLKLADALERNELLRGARLRAFLSNVRNAPSAVDGAS